MLISSKKVKIVADNRSRFEKNFDWVGGFFPNLWEGGGGIFSNPTFKPLKKVPLQEQIEVKNAKKVNFRQIATLQQCNFLSFLTNNLCSFKIVGQNSQKNA